MAAPLAGVRFGTTRLLMMLDALRDPAVLLTQEGNSLPFGFPLRSIFIFPLPYRREARWPATAGMRGQLRNQFLVIFLSLHPVPRFALRQRQQQTILH